MPSHDAAITRRRALAAIAGTATLGGLTGCSTGGGSDDGSGNDDDGTGGGGNGGGVGDGTTMDGTTAGTSDGDAMSPVGVAEDVVFGGHDSVQNLAGAPYLGPPPGEAQGTIVAFSDPSCPRCAAFETGTVETIQAELTSQGKATYVFRGYPIVYPWGKPAAKLLEATLAQDARAHFTLAREYFLVQDSFGMDNVYEKTRQVLSTRTDVDADAVVSAAKAGDADAAVQTDLDAGEAAGATGTPTVFLFRDGKYQTKAVGSVSYPIVKNTLGL
jgi:protein-disulfide isomerase